MTLPATPPISLSQAAPEIGVALPLSLDHPWLIALAGKSGLPVSLGDLLGKTGRFDGSVLCQSGASGLVLIFSNNPWFGGQISALFGNTHPFVLTGLSFAVAPNWSGNILVKNNTTGVSVVLPKTDSIDWSIPTSVPNLMRAFQTDSFTILPSN